MIIIFECYNVFLVLQKGKLKGKPNGNFYYISVIYTNTNCTASLWNNISNLKELKNDNSITSSAKY